MFANFFQLFTRKPESEYEDSFVRDVQVETKEPRSRRSEQLIVIGWILIALKSAFVWWACTTYPVPFHPLWIIGPTVAFAALCTWVYWRR